MRRVTATEHQTYAVEVDRSMIMAVRTAASRAIDADNFRRRLQSTRCPTWEPISLCS